MWNLAARILLLCHYSLVFSLSVLCTVFFVRTRDRMVFRFLRILYPLFIYSLISLLYYLFYPEMAEYLGESISAVSLFLLVLTCIAVPLVLYGISGYLLSLLGLTGKRRRIGSWIVRLSSLLFFFLGFYFIIFLNGDKWLQALPRAINELFIYASLFLLILAVTASFYVGKTGDRRKKQLLRGIMIAFFPMALFCILDLFFFRDSPYKLVYLSYFIFCILVYLYTSRYYIQRYDPDQFHTASLSKETFSVLGLSEREQELIPLLLKGMSNSEISRALYISPNTVKSHIRNIYKKSGVSNRLQLMSRIRNHPER